MTHFPSLSHVKKTLRIKSATIVTEAGAFFFKKHKINTLKRVLKYLHMHLVS